MSKLYYLASPYTHNNENIRQQRFEQASKITVDLLKYNIFTFSPIAYNHPMVKFDLPTDWGFWKEYDSIFLKKCDGLIVLQLEGWNTSIGVLAEIEIAKTLNLSINYLDPNNLEDFVKKLS